MHETVIARGIIEEAEKHGKVEKIFLEIGELAHVPGHELLECLERLVDWKIISTEKKAKAICTCGFEGHPKILERGHDSFMIECPKCKKIPKLIGGTEIIIKKVVVS